MMKTPHEDWEVEGPKIGAWLCQGRGVTTTEAVILILLGVLVVLGGIQVFGGGIAHQYDNVTRALTGGDDDGEEERGERRASVQAKDDAQESGVAQNGESRADEGGRAVHTGEVDGEGVAMGEAPEEREEASGSVGGVNPLIILLLIGAVLAVGYFIFADDE